MTTYERARERLGLFIDTIEGRKYRIDQASGQLILRIMPIVQLSAPPIVNAPPAEPLACTVCGDTLPDDAAYCITCGARVAAMGRTERL